MMPIFSPTRICGNRLTCPGTHSRSCGAASGASMVPTARLDPHLAAVGLDQPVDEFQRGEVLRAGRATTAIKAPARTDSRVPDRGSRSAVKGLADLVDLDQRRFSHVFARRRQHRAAPEWPTPRGRGRRSITDRNASPDGALIRRSRTAAGSQ